MILRKLQWILLCKLLCSVIIVVESQNERSYDPNDWIPITASPNANAGDSSQPAIGRVLNLDAPAQKFFPEQDYYRKRNSQQYLRESPPKPVNVRQKQKNADTYRFEVPPQVEQLRLATYEQPPPVNQGEFLEKQILTRQQAPAINAPNTYNQYNLPFNSSFYESLNPSSINQELQSSFETHNLPAEPSPSASITDVKQDIQLLYVPLENLKPSQQVPQNSKNIFHQINVPRQENPIYSQNNQHLIDDIEQDLIQQTVQAHRLQQQIHLGRPVYAQPTAATTTTTTTATVPTKRKPHQPPLAVYLDNHNGADVDDVLNALREAKTIAVQDAVLPSSPTVFVGPSTINLPSTYTRFPLPYINKLESNKLERKIENLPFFVAPLSYKTPPGYSKIPLPSPHVGSVVISNKEDSHKRSAPKPTTVYTNQVKEYEQAKPSYPVPSATPNPQIFDPGQHTYYSTTPFFTPTSDAQKPTYLQFNVNNANQFPVSARPTETLQQHQLNVNNIPSRAQPQISQAPGSSFTSPAQSVSYNPTTTTTFQHPQVNVNNLPSRTQPQTSQAPINSFNSPVQSVSYNPATITNTSPQTISQQVVPERNSNVFSSPVRTTGGVQAKYNFNQDQNIRSYPTTTSVTNTNHETVTSHQTPIKSNGQVKYNLNQEQKIKSYQTPTTVSNTNQQTINSYQIPVKSSSGITQYNQQLVDKKEQFGIPQTVSNEKSNSYYVPSRVPQRSRQTTTVPPTTTTISPYDEPSDSFISSPFKHAHEISITPKTSTTTKPITKESYSYAYERSHKKQNPLELAINQYELHEINSQLEDSTEKEEKDPFDFSSHFRYKPKSYDFSSQFEGEKSKAKGKYGYSSVFDLDIDKPKFDYSSEFERYTSTPASILRDTFEEIPTTPRVSPKSRRRGKPSRQPVRTTTTEHPPGKESYTILEEFSAKPGTTPEPTKVLKEVKSEPEYTIPTQPDVPANVYRIRTTTHRIEEDKVEPVTIQYDNIRTVNDEISPKLYNQNTPVYTSPNYQNIPSQNFDKSTSQSIYGKNEEATPPTYVQSPLTEISYSPEYNENSSIKPLVQNRGQKQEDESYNFDNKPDQPNYTSDIQDQSIRTLLVPEQHQSTPNFESLAQQPITTTSTTTTTTTTTEKPKTTHTTRARGRQRGGSRFSSASTTTASVPRRTVNRRRPVHSSRTTTTTTENPNIQYSSKEDIPKVTRQRFRTRGRPNQPVATERISSTENEVRSYKEQTSEVPLEFQTDPTSPQSYMKLEHTIEDQKIIIQQEDIPVTDYPQYYNPQLPVTVTESPRHLIKYDNTDTTKNPVMDIQITHPVTKTKKHPVAATRTNEETQVNLQAGGVLHNSNNENNNNGYDGSSRQTSRVRGRTRTRPRVATTTEKPIVKTTGRPVIRVAPKRTTTVATTTTTTQKPSFKSQTEEEFFGFIRQPNFNQIYNIPVPAATQQPLSIYQNIPNEPANTDVRVSTYQVFGGQDKNPNVRVQSYQIPQDPQPADDVRLNFNSAPDDATTVHFLGEIRPKFRANTQNYEETAAVTDPTEPIRVGTETPRPRIRGRVRTPQKKSNGRTSDNEVSTHRTQQATRRSNVVRSRGRGTAHYRSPENLRSKEEKEADVEGGNYPPQFFQNRQTSTTTSAPVFQISIDPADEDEYGDQLPNPSLLHPKILPRPEEWTEATENTVRDEEFAPANSIDDDIHIEGETVSPDGTQATELPTKTLSTDEVQTTDQPFALPVTASIEQTTQNSDEAYREDTKAMEELFEEVNKTEEPRKAKGRRRGVWKLIRQRPVDQYEVAESQNYFSVVNAYGDIVKVKDKVKSYGKEESEETGFGQHELYNNYNPVLEQNSETYDYESQKLSSTEKPEQKTSKYYEVHDLNAETEQSVMEASSTVEPEQHDNDNSTESSTAVTTTTVKEGSMFDTIYEMFGISKSEDVDELPTTTVSATEPETVPPTTTLASPTFPEEITEFPTTEAALEVTSDNSTETTETTDKIETTSKKPASKTFDVEPWEMRAVRTSTSTEVSHETEICYKGRCVRSNDRSGL